MPSRSSARADSDLIRIRGLALRCIIGTYPHERTRKQRLFLDLDVPCDARQPARRDNLKVALDYDRLTRRVREWAGKTRFLLIETFAERLATMLLQEFELRRITLTVWKPGALRDCRNLGLSITRTGRGRT